MAEPEIVTTTTQETTTKTTTTGLGGPGPVLSFVQQQPGLLVTKELDKAIEDCKAKVARIAKTCQARNRKFRDIEFDLENDKENCLYGLFTDEEYYPADVHRVTQIFDKPHFFDDDEKPGANDIIQGATLNDTWFLSALATVSTVGELIKTLCVARDEKVGVYGFIFFRDNAWKTVIIDDMLYTRVPKYEELRPNEQELYHHDKDTYNASARKGGKSLYFAKSSETGETWVPLIEKAYAKLHGAFSHIVGGDVCDAIEDLTGGVSTVLQSKDILDTDRFWEEELLRANKDRLFGCSFTRLDTTRGSYSTELKVQGLMGDHAYSVLRAVEVKGKRFVVVRNPWGSGEWTGRWSDGSKEWTAEWLDAMPELQHVFGDDGQFVMEYSDWLDCFSQIDRTLLFDSSWVMSSSWLRVPARPLPAAWSYGDVSFTFSLPAKTNAVLVLSQIDSRYFKDLAGKATWSLDFILFKFENIKHDKDTVKLGEKEKEKPVITPIAEVPHSEFGSRSVNLEIELEEGEYVVYVRLDRFIEEWEVEATVDESKLRKLSRLMTERSKSQSIASNFKKSDHAPFLGTDLDTLVEKDFSEFQAQKEKEAADGKSKTSVTTAEEVAEDGTSVTTTTTIVTTETKQVVVKTPVKKPAPAAAPPDGLLASVAPTSGLGGPSEDGLPTPPTDISLTPSTVTVEGGKVTVPYDDTNHVTIGLRVYTNKDVPASVVGRLRSGEGSVKEGLEVKTVAVSA